MSKWRRLRRGLVIAFAGGLVLYLALLVYGRVRLRRAEAAFLKTFGTLDLASFERPDPPRAQNAAEWLQAGAQAVFLDAESKALLSDAASRARPDWSDTNRKRITGILDDNRCALELLHRAVSASQTSYRIRYSHGVQAELPNTMALRTAGALLAVEARIDIESGHPAAAAVALKALARLATSLESEPILMTLLTGIATEHLLLQALTDVAVRPSAAADQAALLRAARDALPGNDVAAETRRAFAPDALGMSAALAGRAGATDDWQPTDARLLAFLLAPFSDLVRAEVLDQFAALASVLDAPPTSGGISGDERPGRASYLPHVRLAAIVVPGFARARDAARDALGRRHLVSTALALRSRGATDAYPATLPPELQRPDPLTGRPLAYTLNPDGSATLALQLDAAAAARMPLSLRAIALPPPTRPTTRR